MNYTYLDTPIGPLLVAGDAQGLRLIHFAVDGEPAPAPAHGTQSAAALRHACAQLEEYFAGKRKTFDLSLAPQSTPFQALVLDQLIAIPYGQTRSYSQLAQALDKPKASRAVGTACARNPLPIVIPCHRVVGQNGSLTGFAGGLEAKRWLLRHEAPV